MSQSLKQTCFDIWNTKEIRKGLQSSFQPLFIRYIGIENNKEYNDILKTFEQKIEDNKEISIFFKNEIPFPQNFQLLSMVSEGLKTMDINHFKDDDIVLFQDSTLNHIFTESLNYVLHIAYQKEKFINESTRNSFITKLVLWTYEYTKKINFFSDKNPKCVYYGNITRHEVYFLMILYRMTFDVIYINSLKDEYFDEIDVDKFSELHTSSFIQPIESFEKRIQNAKILDYNESFLYQMQNQIDSQLYGNGVYKPWQLRGYNTIPISKQCVMIDLQNNINEPAKVRDGFQVSEKVTIPCFFMKIDGVYKNQTEYTTLVSKCCESELAKILITQDFINPWKEADMFQLSFIQLSDGSFDIDKMKQLPFYQYSNFKTELQDFILNKINETIMNNTLKIKFTQEILLKYVMNLLHLKNDFIRLIDNFDFANDIPKLIIFLEKETQLNIDNLMLLAFFHQIGMDIILFDPSGMTNTDNIIETNMISNIRLDFMKYDMIFEETKKKQKKGFWNKFLKG